MQLTGSVFLFLFLPLSLPLMLLLPKAHRRIALSLLSILWYMLANLNNLQGLLHIGGLVFFAILLAYLPMPHSVRGAKLRTAVFITVPLLSLMAARIVSEYVSSTYQYPLGLLFATLGVISYAIDYARGDVIRPRNPLELIGYLLFFPTLMLGPVVRSKQYFDLTEDLSMTPELFSQGIRLYMLGFIKRIAIAAVLMRAMQDLLTYSETTLSFLSLVLLLIFSYLYFYFFITGSADLARGVCAMYGISLPRDRGNLLFATTPDRMLCGTMLSLRNYLLDYVEIPLSRKYRGKKGKLLSIVLIFVITVLIFRTRAELLLMTLPVLILALLTRLTSAKKLLTLCHPWRLLLSLLSALLCSFFTLALVLKTPMDLFSFFKSSFAANGNELARYIPGAIQDARYLLFLAILLLMLLPWSYLRKYLLRRASERGRLILSIAETASLFAGFVLTLIYFLPQFPLYADYAYGIYRL